MTSHWILDTFHKHLASCASQLGIEFHANIGMVLSIILVDVGCLHALRYHSKSAVCGLLDSHVGVRVLIWKDKDKHLRTSLKGIASSQEELLDARTDVALILHHEGGRIGNVATMILVC